MSRRNAVCPACGKKGRSEGSGGGPLCGAVWIHPKCACGTMMIPDPTPPKDRKPTTGPNGQKRRYGARKPAGFGRTP